MKHGASYPSPFTDTSNPEIIKAAQLEIVYGMGGGLFMPTRNVTRQEICVMILRALSKALPALDKSIDGPFPFTDAHLIATWAADAMRFAYKNEIMRGMDNNIIAPENNTTREQAIVLLKRAYEKYLPAVGENPPVTPPEPEIAGTVLLNPPSPPLAELDKFTQQDFSLRLGDLAYRTKLELYASTEAGKPATKPSAAAPTPYINATYLTDPAYLAFLEGTGVEVASISGIASDTPGGLLENSVAFVIPPIIINPWLLAPPAGPHYTTAPFAAFVDKSGSKQHWFAFTLSTAASKVVWQVSKAPYGGFAENWRTPPGLVASGEVLPSAGEFMIDFRPLNTAGPRPRSSTPHRLWKPNPSSPTCG